MKRLVMFLLFLSFMCITYAQDVESWRKMIADMLEQLAEQQDQDIDYEVMVDDLLNLAQNPINLNNTNREELERIFFLTDYQIENILFYQYNNGPILSIYELQAVEDLDGLTIERILPFVRVGDVIKEKPRFTHWKYLGRVQSIMQTPRGYMPKADTIPAAYAGSKVRWLSKAHVSVNDRLVMGFTLEKDPGEKAFLPGKPLTDFHSGFLQINNMNKVVDKILIGDYRLSFGQGLGVWTDMAFSKSSETSQLRRRSTGLKSYTSVNESSFLRGLAMELDLKYFSLTPFFSIKAIDGSLQSDSLQEEEYVSSILETGYHRTLTEIKNRHSVKETIWGGQLQYKHHLFRLEGGCINWQVNKTLQPATHIRNKYRFDGKQLNAIWLSPTVFWGRLNLFGELVRQNDNQWGIYQGFTYKPGSDIITSLAYRRYSKGFSAILSHPFSESSIPGGESGIYASFQFKPHAKWTIKTYADLFSYSWLRYNVYAPSSGFEWFIQADCRINRNQSFYIRYKNSVKETNSSESTINYELASYSKQNIRLYYNCRLSDKWRLNTQLEQSFYDGDKSSKGWMMFQDVIWHSHKVNISLRYILFDIGDYNSRIYSYEPDVLYAFSVPSYQDKGARMIANINTEVVKGLRLWVRLSHSVYGDRESIRSGYQEVNGDKLTEFKLQIQYRFSH